MRKFKRSINIIIVMFFSLLYLPCMMKYVDFFEIISQRAYEVDYAQDLILTTEYLICIIVLELLLVAVVIPPDFDYVINVTDSYIIFSFDKEDKRKIDKKFKISRKKRHYILLDDGVSKIRIVYNKEVLQFLEEVKES